MMACGYTSGFMERLPQRQSMASIGRLAVLCIAPVACSEDQTGFDLAPSLGAVERFLPETHRTRQTVQRHVHARRNVSTF